MPANKRNNTNAEETLTREEKAAGKGDEKKPKLLMSSEAYDAYKRLGLWVFFSHKNLAAYAHAEGIKQIGLSDLQKLFTEQKVSRSCDCGCGKSVESLVEVKQVNEDGIVQTDEEGNPYLEGQAIRAKLADGQLGMLVLHPDCIEEMRRLAKYPKRDKQGKIQFWPDGKMMMNTPHRQTIAAVEASLARSAEGNQERTRKSSVLWNPNAPAQRTVFGGNDDGDVGNRPHRASDRDNRGGGGKRDRNWR